jgi:hypothetical protein
MRIIREAAGHRQPFFLIVPGPGTPARRTVEHLAVGVEDETGEGEFCDLVDDPPQLLNLQSRVPPALLSQRSARLAELATYAGATCRTPETAPAH